MTTPQCLCVLNRKRACEACIMLAERESAYESNVDPLYRDKASALETEDWTWEVHGNSDTFRDDGVSSHYLTDY